LLVETYISNSYNDYRIEGINNKSNTLYELVKGYLRDGVPIDGVGFQAHFGLGVIPQDIAQNLKRFTDLGLEVTITELDINMRAPANQTNLIQQAKDYYQVVSACVAVPKCTGVVSQSLLEIGNPNAYDQHTVGVGNLGSP
jgi:GH35 family endo-1,4-beta-xylanase